MVSNNGFFDSQSRERASWVLLAKFLADDHRCFCRIPGERVSDLYSVFCFQQCSAYVEIPLPTCGLPECVNVRFTIVLCDALAWYCPGWKPMLFYSSRDGNIGPSKIRLDLAYV